MRASLCNRLSVLALLLVWFPAGSALAQVSEQEELDKIRHVLSLSAAASVKVAPAPALPSARPLKVHVATGLDVRVRRNFIDWIEEWNRKEGKKDGVLKVVTDAAQAHVILVRVTDREKAKLTSQTQTTPSTALGAGGTTRTRTERHTYSFYQGPIYAYVLRVNGPNTLEIVARYTKLGDVDESKSSGRDLWEDFKKLLKERGAPGQ